MNTDYGGGYWILLAFIAVSCALFLFGALLLTLLQGAVHLVKKNARSLLLWCSVPLFAPAILGPILLFYLLLEPYNLGTISLTAINLFICLPISLGLCCLVMKLINAMECRLLANSSTTNSQSE